MPDTLPLPLLIPDLPDADALLPFLRRMDLSQQYSNFGPLALDFEEQLRRRFSVDGAHDVAVTTVSSDTLGLELSLAALQLAPKSRVLIPALTFVATATAVARAGHVPVAADVDPDNWLLTPEIAREALSRTRFEAVLPVATFGVAQSMPGWAAFERDTGVRVIVDAAAAFGSQTFDGATGTFVLSLHATKSLPAGEGGVVVSTDAALIARVRQMSNFGINLDPLSPVAIGHLASLGTNAKLSEYHAAVALASLQRWEQGAQRRKQLMGSLRALLSAEAGGAIGWQGGSESVAAPTLFCAHFREAGRREQLERICASQRIATRRWYQPLLKQMDLAFADTTSLATPAADELARGLLGLPFFVGMTRQQQELLARVVASSAAPKPLAAVPAKRAVPAERSVSQRGGGVPAVTLLS
jgi:dTDP-4-amino-4,6-dideoxygalactose transaminase